MRIAGIDLGKSSASFAIININEHGLFSIEEMENVDHGGRPLEVFQKWYRQKGISSCLALGATGLYSDEIGKPAHVLPEDACQEAALGASPALSGELNLVSVGARGYSILTRQRIIVTNDQSEYRCQFLENDKCSSGAGENIKKTVVRFGLDIKTADDMARAADEGIPITARCSVFAKSEITHFANQGKDTGRLLKGFFDSTARNVRGLLARQEVDGDVYLIGGCSRIGAFVNAFEQAIDRKVQILENGLCFEALGAATLAAEHFQNNGKVSLPEDVSSLIQVQKKSFAPLKPAFHWKNKVTIMDEEHSTPVRQAAPAILGLDLGSTGSKAVLVSVETGETVLDVYDRTRGNPIDAAHRLVKQICELTTPDIRAIGITGSGREAVATLFKAVFSEDNNRIVVLNEIVAHATAAIQCDENGGRDLSIVEIGGQDAKYVRVLEGKIVESDMNQACSAGTGSFLEEQAQIHGIDEIEEFIDMASKAQRPPDLGQMCTVYVAEAAAEALMDDYNQGDVFAGFQYSVIHNYINRVMGQRTFGETVFFQGKPASNPSLAWTLAAVSDRNIVVPPNPGAMGARGIGLCAIEQIKKDRLMTASPLEIRDVLATEIVERSEFRCADKKCSTMCSIDKTVVSAGGKQKNVISGGVCPKYEISNADLPRLEKDAPNPFQEREELLAKYIYESTDKTIVGIPRLISYHDILPWMSALINELGFSVKLLESDATSLGKGEQMCYVSDACGSIKIAHAVCDQDVPRLFMPKIARIADPDGPGGRTCPAEQGLPETLRLALKARGRELDILHPVLHFERNWGDRKILASLLPMAKELGVGKAKMKAALKKAAKAQKAYEAGLRKIGERAINYSLKQNVPAVMMAGPLHVIHERRINADIPGLIRKNGAIAIPMDCFPIDKKTTRLEKAYWAYTNRSLRTAIAARQAGHVYPLLLTSFGCGPASFTEPFFQTFMEGYPYTILESDGHGGSAGYITRIQAFLHTVHQYRKDEKAQRKSINPTRISDMEGSRDKRLPMDKETHYVLFALADRLSPFMAAIYRSYGYDFQSAPVSKDSFLRGKLDCSGKECVPYQIVWGSFRKYLEDNPPDKRTVLLMVSGETPCRNGMMEMKDRISVDKMGLSDKVSVEFAGPYANVLISPKIWIAMLAWDALYNFYAYHVAVESAPGKSHEMYLKYCDKVEALLERKMNMALLPFQLLRTWFGVKKIMREASREFKAMERSANKGKLKTILVSGDIYVRLDELSSDSLVRRLGEKGLRCIVEPFGVLMEYFTYSRTSDFFGAPKNWFMNFLFKNLKIFMRHSMYGMIQKTHPWLPNADIPEILKHSEPILEAVPQGEAPVTVGSVLHNWHEKNFDGVVLPSPWGCGPALVSEGILKHFQEIPSLFIYTEGTPIDERRIAGFAHRINRTAAPGEEREKKAPIRMRQSVT